MSQTYTNTLDEDGYLGTMILKDGEPFANAATGLDASTICEELNNIDASRNSAIKTFIENE